VPKEICQRCNQERPNVGPWKQAGCEYTRLCGGCKIRYTAEQPGFKERLQNEVRAFVAFTAAVDKALKDGGENNPS